MIRTQKRFAPLTARYQTDRNICNMVMDQTVVSVVVGVIHRNHFYDS